MVIDSSQTYKNDLQEYLGEGVVSVSYCPDFLGYDFKWERRNKVVSVRVADIKIMRNNNYLNTVEMVANMLKTEMNITGEERCRWVMDKLLGKI